MKLYPSALFSLNAWLTKRWMDYERAPWFEKIAFSLPLGKCRIRWPFSKTCPSRQAVFLRMATRLLNWFTHPMLSPFASILWASQLQSISYFLGRPGLVVGIKAPSSFPWFSMCLYVFAQLIDFPNHCGGICGKPLASVFIARGSVGTTSSMCKKMSLYRTALAYLPGTGNGKNSTRIFGSTAYA